MKVAVMVAGIVVVVSASGCESDSGRVTGEREESVAAASDLGVDREDCRVTSNASVRGVTGSFASAEDAARSVEGLPAEGRLVRFEANEDSATFGWEARGLLTHIIYTHRGDDGWTVGSYEECAGRS